MRKLFASAAILAALASPAFATNPNDGAAGALVIGQAVTLGVSASVARGGTVANPSASESFSRGTAGFGRTGNGTFGAYQTTESGAITQGNAFGAGVGVSAGAFIAGFGAFSRF